MMKSMDLTVGDALYLCTICPILPNSSSMQSVFVLVALYRTAQTCMAPSSNPTAARLAAANLPMLDDPLRSMRSFTNQRSVPESLFIPASMHFYKTLPDRHNSYSRQGQKISQDDNTRQGDF
jgi:hypothetical protein